MENPENMEKMENINQMTKNNLLMIQNTLFVTQKTLFVTQNTLIINQITQNIKFWGIYGNGQKIITNALGEHDPRLPQEGGTSSEM